MMYFTLLKFYISYCTYCTTNENSELKNYLVVKSFIIKKINNPNTTI